MTFDDWLNEQEGYSIRAERIPPLAIEWARAAWDVAYSRALEEAAKVAEETKVVYSGSPKLHGQHVAATIRALADVRD